MPLLTDARHGLRLLGRSPLFAITAIASLALGIAASSAVYSVADALLAPAAGIRDSAGVVDVGRGNDGSGFDNMSYPAFDYLRRHATSFEGLAGVEFGGRPMSLTVGGQSERVFGNLVSASFFDVLARLSDLTEAPHYPMPLPVVVPSRDQRDQLLRLEPVPTTSPT